MNHNNYNNQYNSGSFVKVGNMNNMASSSSTSNATSVHPLHANSPQQQQQISNLNNVQHQHLRTGSNLSVTTISTNSSMGQPIRNSGSDVTARKTSKKQTKQGSSTVAHVENSLALSSSTVVKAMASSLQVPSMSHVEKVVLTRPMFFPGVEKYNRSNTQVHELQGSDEEMTQNNASIHLFGGYQTPGNNQHPLRVDKGEKSNGDKFHNDSDHVESIFSSYKEHVTYQPIWRGAQVRLQSELNRITETSASKKQKVSLGTASMDASLQLISESYAEKAEINSLGGSCSNGDNLDKQINATSFGSSTSFHLLNDFSGPIVTPLFSCDDAALPCDADLGTFETREEEQNYMAIKSEQQQIEKVVPNIFGVIRCPCPAVGPDDSSSWKSRLVAGKRGGTSIASGGANSQTSNELNSVKNRSFDMNENSSQNTRGWWDASEQSSVSSPAPQVFKGESKVDDGRVAKNILKLHPSRTLLKQLNLPATLLHPGTSAAERLPFLSDRLPCHRHLQIETQSVVFSDIGGEIEPMFCSLAIYHIEGSGPRSPIASRCNRVSEILHFDMVTDSTVEDLCGAALWPRGRSEAVSNGSDGVGTNCGIFALPSSLDVSKLFAVLTVKKVLCEEVDGDIYTKQTSNKEQIDISKCRTKAAKSCDRLGQFLMPFAFGIVDLKEAIEDGSLSVPKSLMVQIPLSRFRSGSGNKPIIESIISRRYPSRELPNGIFEPVSGGNASFLLRYFGFKGIQDIVDSVSTLAPDRIIDSSGSVQIRRVNVKSKDLSQDGIDEKSDLTRKSKLKSFLATEKTFNGGRNSINQNETSHGVTSQPDCFAQELLPVPLHLTLSRVIRRESKSYRSLSNSNNDIHRFSYSTYCNDILCRVERLHGCLKRNIVVKIELRKCKWDAVSATFIASPSSKSIYNQRRGEHLVDCSFTDCAYHVQNPSWNDEFKVRLPDVLEEDDALVFSVYNVAVRSKRKTLNLISRSTSKPTPSYNVDFSDGLAALELLGCGILPLMSFSEDSTCLIANDYHDVNIKYTTRLINNNRYESGTLILEPLPKKSVTGIHDNSEKQNKIARGTTFENVSKAIAKVKHSGSSISNEAFNLQIRIFSMSSVHPQDQSIAKIVKSPPQYPQYFNQLQNSSLFDVNDAKVWNHQFNNLNLNDDHLKSETYRSEEEWIVKFAALGKCPAHEKSAHLLRLIRPIWRCLVVGTGKPSLLWANPSSLIPLRLQSFSTLLLLMDAAATFQSRSGLTELNGKSRWEIASLSSLVVLDTDEGSLFGLDNLSHEDIYIEETNGFQEGNDKDGKSSEKCQRRRQRNVPTASSPNDMFASMLKSIASEESDGIFPKDESEPLKKSVTNVDSKRIFDTFSKKESVEFPRMNNTNTPVSMDDSVLLQSIKVENPINTRRKYMTLGGLNSPGLSSLATISEKHDDGSDVEESVVNGDDINVVVNDEVDEEIQVSLAPIPVKQMRIPRVSSSETNESSEPTPVKQMRIPRVSSSETNESSKSKSKVNKPNSIFNNPEPGGGIYDMIGKQIGAIRFSNKDMWGEERLVGTTHSKTLNPQGHRKVRNMCSIDLSLPAFDKILEDEEQLEETLSDLNNLEDQGKSSRNDMNASSNLQQSSPPRQPRNPSSNWLDFSFAMKEKYTSPTLRDFSQRISIMKNDTEGYWWPFIYEVVIYQWVALLVEQTQSGDKKDFSSPPTHPSFIRSYLRESAKQVQGITIGGAPFLFEIIKKSLMCRVHGLFESGKIKGEHRPISLDTNLYNSLENLISMVTDACIDSRNFDSYEFRKKSIDVNDSIVRFLRDLFAILSHKQIHRLIFVYFSRFVTKGGNFWLDRDSKIGLRCSWEVCKLRLNAVTILTRFPDLVEVNRPMMKHWECWSFVEQTEVNRRFFTKSLEQFLSLGNPHFAASDGPVMKKAISIPERKPHWLIELLTDICLAASEHADQAIQLRGSSLLHELFWNHSQEGKANGNSSVIASMYVPFIPKVLGHLYYLSSLPSKCQLRKDIMPCVTYILQSAPSGLLRALWRKLCKGMKGCGEDIEKYGGFGNSLSEFLLVGDEDAISSSCSPDDVDGGYEHNILDLYSLLNLALTTLEYEGSDRSVEGSEEVNLDQFETWEEEFLAREEHENITGEVLSSTQLRKKANQDEKNKPRKINTTASRRWHAHDSALVICQTSRYIVDEVLRSISTKYMPLSFSKNLHLKGSREQNGEHNQRIQVESDDDGFLLNFSVYDTLVFVRAVTSLYLHILSLKQSDVVICKAMIASVEILKIFGIKVFLVSVGDTLQHWMRVILIQCGAKRANVRVQALEFLALVLRLTWDTYGSIARVRVPLLAIQMEVMERIVSLAARRFYHEQRLLGKPAEFLPSNAAEAALSPLWRTFDRMHRQSGSKNIAFKTALESLAMTLKKLHTAYIAAHALALTTRLATSKSIPSDDVDDMSFKSVNSLTSNNVGRIFFGLHVATSTKSVAHNEAVEDAFLAVADVFKPTVLPLHRVAWLRKLAEFHSSRNKFGEEATCRFHIYLTLKQAATHYNSLWNPSPFLPWAGKTDDYQVDGEAADIEGNIDGNEMSGDRLDKVESFRKMFYRAASSVIMRTGEWEINLNKNVFFGVCTPDDYSNDAFMPWFTLREIEEEMVEEIEHTGNLFLKANLEDFSRKAWGLAAEFYSLKYNYPRLSRAYLKLSQVVTSHVPIVDTSNQIELSSHFGRFYRVWFHGSAPDELNGKEFVYRSHVSIRLEEFGSNLVAVLKSLLPDGTPIDLVLDDGRPEMHDGLTGIRNPNANLIRERRPSQRRPVAHMTAGLQPIRDVGVCQIKITPLRPLLCNEVSCRGSLEWFYRRSEQSNAFDSLGSHTNNSQDSTEDTMKCLGHHPRSKGISFGGSTFGGLDNRYSLSTGSMNYEGDNAGQNSLGGVDTFSFTQPIQTDRRRGARDWLRTPGDFSEKSLRITKLVVSKSFPTFVSRQRVLNRIISYQCPLEAGVEAICSWCSVLFRTVVATNGRAVLRGVQETDRGVGRAAAKVVADAIHCARVKELAQVLLTNNVNTVEKEHNSSFTRKVKDKLSDNEVSDNQIRLARGIVMYMELLHILIVRNRDMLLQVVKRRRQSRGLDISRQGGTDGQSVGSRSMIDRTNDSIAVQSELQRAFIAMAKALYPNLSQIIPHEIQSWLKDSSQDSYFSSGIYQRANISLAEELLFEGNANTENRDQSSELYIANSSIPQSLYTSNRAPPFINSVTLGTGSINGDVPSNSIISGDGRSYISG